MRHYDVLTVVAAATAPAEPHLLKPMPLLLLPLPLPLPLLLPLLPRPPLDPSDSSTHHPPCLLPRSWSQPTQQVHHWFIKFRRYVLKPIADGQQPTTPIQHKFVGVLKLAGTAEDEAQMAVKAILSVSNKRKPAETVSILEVRVTVYVCFRAGSTHLSIDVHRTMSYGTRLTLFTQVTETRSTLRARQTSPYCRFGARLLRHCDVLTVVVEATAPAEPPLLISLSLLLLPLPLALPLPLQLLLPTAP